MTADTPTILATSGGLVPAPRTLFGFGPLLHYAIELAGVTGRAPRVCYVGTGLAVTRKVTKPGSPRRAGPPGSSSARCGCSACPTWTT